MRWADSITGSMDMNLGQTLGNSGAQRSLTCCNPQGLKESAGLKEKRLNNQDTNVLVSPRIPAVVQYY